MTLNDLTKRIDDYRLAAGLPAIGQDETQAIELDARRSLCELETASFVKEVSLTLAGGVAFVYRLSPPTNTDILWWKYGRAVHADGHEITVLPLSCSSRFLSYPRFEGYYYAVIETNGNDVTLTVRQGDGATDAPDGAVLCDFGFVQSLASWPAQYDSLLVAKCADLLSGSQQPEGV